MSEAIRKSRWVPVPGATDHGTGVDKFVAPVHMTRCTVVVRMVGKGARQWRRFLAQHEQTRRIYVTGNTDATKDGVGHHPVSGLPRALAFRVEAESALLLEMEQAAKMGQLPIERFEYSTHAIPRTGGGQGPEKIVARPPSPFAKSVATTQRENELRSRSLLAQKQMLKVKWAGVPLKPLN